MLGRYARDSVVLLTTQERSSVFRSVLGPGVDARFSPEETSPLADFLFNCANSGAQLAVLDESHFICMEDMLTGVQEFLDELQSPTRAMDFIVVCPQRSAGDILLEHLVTYCGIYGVVWGCDDAQVCMRIARLLHAPNTRRDVLELIRRHRSPRGSRLVRTHVSSGEVSPVETCGDVWKADGWAEGPLPAPSDVGWRPGDLSVAQKTISKPMSIDIRIEIQPGSEGAAAPVVTVSGQGVLGA